MLLTKQILSNMPVQVLALDKRDEYHKELFEECSKIGEVYPFVCGDGELLDLDRYNMIDFDEKMASKFQWGYAAAGHQVNHFNAFMAQHQMVRRAKNKGWKAFLMIEDDAYITKRFEPIWKSFLDGLDNLKIDADIFYLGWWIGDENDEFNQEIERKYEEESKAFPGAFNVSRCPNIVGGLHGAIITEDIYDLILDLPPNDPVDAHLNRAGLDRYYLSPKIVHTKNIVSSCEGVVVERNVL